MAQLKKCTTCKLILLPASFMKASANPDGLQYTCRACMVNFRLKKRYGLSFDEAVNLLTSQGSGCAICEKELTVAGGTAHIDHDHTTGKVRGVLCSRCNQGLGLFGDSQKHLTRAVNYLEHA